MNRFEKINFKSRLFKLAKLKGTGTPADLADRFEISERTIKRIVRELRDEGINIWYCPSAMSYVIEEKNAKHVV
jgi:predicted DNA-binding transcriptional regulator YafY